MPSAMMSPTATSPFALMVPTWAMSFLPLVGVDSFASSATMTWTALSMPRLRSIGPWPAATSLSPSS